MPGHTLPISRDNWRPGRRVFDVALPVPHQPPDVELLLNKPVPAACCSPPASPSCGKPSSAPLAPAAWPSARRHPGGIGGVGALIDSNGLPTYYGPRGRRFRPASAGHRRRQRAWQAAARPTARPRPRTSAKAAAAPASASRRHRAPPDAPGSDSTTSTPNEVSAGSPNLWGLS